MILFFVQGGYSAELDDYQKEIDTLLERTGAELFINDTKFIQKHKNVSFADERQYSIHKYENYWEWMRELNITRYENELRGFIQVNYSAESLNRLVKFYKKGFYTRVFKSLYTAPLFFKTYNDLLLGRRELIALTDQRMKIIKSLYTFLGMAIIEENVLIHFNTIGADSDYSYEVKDILSQKSSYIRAERFKEFSKNIKNQLYYFLIQTMINYTDHELRNFLDQMKDSTIRSYIQLHLNFHYLFLLDLLIEKEKELGLLKLDLIL